ncbi:MAG: shikimate kinase [Bacteroidota bacterium]
MNPYDQKQKKSLIFLTGFMGSGKSTIGPILANTLGFEFVDVDKLIEQRAEQRIVDIFETKGEEAFRVLERRALQELSSRNDCVVSLGGGTIANEENFQLMHRNGVIVYLQLSPEEILQRVQHRPDRPLLRDGAGKPLAREMMEQRIVELLQRREPFYARADIIVPSDKMRVGFMVDEIVKKLRRYV